MAKTTVMRSCCDRFKNEEHHPDCQRVIHRKKSKKTNVYRVAYTIRGHVLVDGSDAKDARVKAEQQGANTLLLCADETIFETLGEEGS